MNQCKILLLVAQHTCLSTVKSQIVFLLKLLEFNKKTTETRGQLEQHTNI